MSNYYSCILRHPKVEVTIKICNSPYTIGRSPDCDYEVPSQTVARLQCTLEKTDAGWVLISGCSIGTMVNGAVYPVNTSCLLENLDVISLGIEQWTFQFILTEIPRVNLPFPLLRHRGSDSTIESDEYATNSSPLAISNSNKRKRVSRTHQRPDIARPQRHLTSKRNRVNNLRPIFETNATVHQLQRQSSQGDDLSEDRSAVIGSADLDKLSKTSETAQNAAQGNFESVKTELTCSICSQLFIKAVTIYCSHSFCEYCVNRWKKKSSSCPICRNPIHAVTDTLVLNNLVEKIMDNASPEDQKQRQQAIRVRRLIERKSAVRREQRCNVFTFF